MREKSRRMLGGESGSWIGGGDLPADLVNNNDGQLTGKTPLMIFWGEEKNNVWMRGHTTNA